MAFTFTLDKESLKRKFAVYVVVARSSDNTKLYVGKTGDNNDGCNPLISRCGNHFSCNKMHSQIRNYLDDHEDRDYIYVFDHFDDYPENEAARRECIDKINEMERWLNEEIQRAIEGEKAVQLLNPFTGRGYLPKAEQEKRKAFRTANNSKKISSLVAAVVKQIGQPTIQPGLV
jgi:hypothetical protein